MNQSVTVLIPSTIFCKKIQIIQKYYIKLMNFSLNKMWTFSREKMSQKGLKMKLMLTETFYQESQTTITVWSGQVELLIPQSF